MFANVGWGEMLVLLIAGLVILGPERLPGAIRWTSGALRQARDYVSGATSQLREDLGPEFDDLREPLSQLNKLRGMTPRAALTKHLLDGDDSIFTGKFDAPEDRTGEAGESAAADAGPTRGARHDAVRQRRDVAPPVARNGIPAAKVRVEACWNTVSANRAELSACRIQAQRHACQSALAARQRVGDAA